MQKRWRRRDNQVDQAGQRYERKHGLARKSHVLALLIAMLTQLSCCAVLQLEREPRVAGCVGECGPTFQDQLKIPVVLSCPASYVVRLDVLEALCPNESAKVELSRNGNIFYTNLFNGDQFSSPLPLSTLIDTPLSVGDTLTVHASTVLLEDPDRCKRQGNSGLSCLFQDEATPFIIQSQATGRYLTMDF